MQHRGAADRAQQRHAAEFHAMRRAVQQAESRDQRHARAASGSRTASAASAPSTMTEARMPASTPGNATPAKPSRPPSAMRAEEGTRQRQPRRTARKPGPEPDHHHGQQVVRAAERVQEARHQPVVQPVADMGEGRCRQQQRRGEECSAFMPRCRPAARMNSAISATPLFSFRLVKMKGRVPRILRGVAVHHRKVGADQRRQVDLVDHQQVGAGDAGPALARDLVAGARRR